MKAILISLLVAAGMSAQAMVNLPARQVDVNTSAVTRVVLPVPATVQDYVDAMDALAIPAASWTSATNRIAELEGITNSLMHTNDARSVSLNASSITLGGVAQTNWGATVLFRSTLSVGATSTGLTFPCALPVVPDTVAVNIGGGYSTSSGRFTPTRAGWYQLNWTISGAPNFLGTLPGTNTIQSKVTLNGTAYLYGSMSFTTVGDVMTSAGSGLIHLNGSSDYVALQLYVYRCSTNEMTIGPVETKFDGALVRPD